MQFLTNIHANRVNNPGSVAAVIPDVTDWVYEHHFTIAVFEAVKQMQHVLTEAGCAEDYDYISAPDDKLVLTDAAKNLLRANLHDEHWEYLENYFLG